MIIKSFLLLKTVYINKLNQIGLIKQKLSNLNIIYFKLNNKIFCFVTHNTIE
jgi:hypothetical protein